MKLFLFTVVMVLLYCNIYSQASIDIKNSIEDNFELIRNNKPIDENLASICKPENYQSINSIVKPYLIDTIPGIRKLSYKYLAISGLKSSSEAERQNSVNLLLNGCFDNKSSNVLSNIKYLRRYSPSDFNPACKLLLDSLVNNAKFYRNDIYKFAAYIDIPNIEKKLIAKLELETNQKNKWHLNLALARLGNNTSIAYLKNKLTKAKINNTFIYEIIPDLIYTRQNEVYDFLFTIINSDEYICHSGNPDNEKELLCAYFMIEIIAPEIEGFPLQLNQHGELEGYITEESLAKVRNWYLTSNEINIKTNKY